MLQLHEVVVVVVVVGEDGGDFCISCNHDETVLHVMECFQGKIASKCPGTGEMMLVWRSGPTRLTSCGRREGELAASTASRYDREEKMMSVWLRAAGRTWVRSTAMTASSSCQTSSAALHTGAAAALRVKDNEEEELRTTSRRDDVKMKTMMTMMTMVLPRYVGDSGVEQNDDAWNGMRMDSVKRKRKRKMNKHKYQKRMKKQKK